MANPSPSPVNPELQAVEKQHRRETMVLNARPLLARIVLGVWVAIDAVLLVFFAWNVIGYLVSGSFAEMRSMAALGANVGVIHETIANDAAQDLVVKNVKTLRSSSTANDFYASLENPNTHWYATFTYQFTSGGVATDVYEGFVMPGEAKYLLAMNVKSETRSGSAEIALADIAWHRVNRHDVPDVATWLADHQNFVITNSAYTADVSIASSHVGRSSFTVKNDTPYGYWNPIFVVMLERNGTIVGINQATVERFAAGETRQVDVHWTGEIPSSGTNVVLANINFFDAAAYMMPDGNPATDWRDVYGN